jgi:uncharacterized protein (TIGR02453 family)
MREVLDFLSQIKENNNREWFEQNKEWYQACRKKVVFLTELLIHELGKFDDEIGVQDPNQCVFRIYRDVRFREDKTPYKTHFGTYIAKGGRKSIHAGYYLHIEPGASFVGGGSWSPPADALKAIRTEIFDHPEEFKQMVNAPSFRKVYSDFYDDKLKQAPKGFPKDFADIDLLKYKSFAFTSPLEDSMVVSSQFVEKVIICMKELYPVNRFLNNAIEKWM